MIKKQIEMLASSYEIDIHSRATREAVANFMTNLLLEAANDGALKGASRDALAKKIKISKELREWVKMAQEDQARKEKNILKGNANRERHLNNFIDINCI